MFSRCLHACETWCLCKTRKHGGRCNPSEPSPLIWAPPESARWPGRTILTSKGQKPAASISFSPLIRIDIDMSTYLHGLTYTHATPHDCSMITWPPHCRCRAAFVHCPTTLDPSSPVPSCLDHTTPQRPRLVRFTSRRPHSVWYSPELCRAVTALLSRVSTEISHVIVISAECRDWPSGSGS